MAKERDRTSVKEGGERKRQMMKDGEVNFYGKYISSLMMKVQENYEDFAAPESKVIYLRFTDYYF